MTEISSYFGTKVQFVALQIEKRPEEYYTASNWEDGPGAYYIKDVDTLYFVGKYTVDTVYNFSDKGYLFEVINDTYESPKVEESLFLKAIAAAHGHNL
jgi:hypothetical protein